MSSYSGVNEVHWCDSDDDMVCAATQRRCLHLLPSFILGPDAGSFLPEAILIELIACSKLVKHCSTDSSDYFCRNIKLECPPRAQIMGCQSSRGGLICLPAAQRSYWRSLLRSSRPSVLGCSPTKSWGPMLHLHLSLDHQGHWGTTDDFKTSFLHFSLFSTALWDLLNTRLFHS